MTRASADRTGLHAHEGAPDEDGATIQQARDDVAEKQYGIGPAAAHVLAQMPSHPGPERRRLGRFAEERGFFIRGATERMARG
jgi:hypothetical protein